MGKRINFHMKVNGFWDFSYISEIKELVPLWALHYKRGPSRPKKRKKNANTMQARSTRGSRVEGMRRKRGGKGGGRREEKEIYLCPEKGYVVWWNKFARCQRQLLLFNTISIHVKTYKSAVFQKHIYFIVHTYGNMHSLLLLTNSLTE